MYPTIELFGRTIATGDIFLYLHCPTVPFVLFLLRKRYGYTVKKTIFYSAFTFLFGVLAAVITSIISNFILTTTSHGAFEAYETVNSYGIPLFLSLFYLILCLFFRKPFRTITDFCAPAIYLVMVMGKLVCVFNGCCYGPASPHGLYFQNLGYKAIPVQLFDTIDIAIIFTILMILTYTFSKKHPGYLLALGNLLYAFQKACLEELRVYEKEWEGNFFGTGHTYWQFFLLVFFTGSLIWLIAAVIWEKKGKPDFDTAPNIKLPDLSKTVDAFAEKMTAKSKKNNKKKSQNHKKKKKKQTKRSRA